MHDGCDRLVESWVSNASLSTGLNRFVADCTEYPTFVPLRVTQANGKDTQATVNGMLRGTLVLPGKRYYSVP